LLRFFAAMVINSSLAPLIELGGVADHPTAP